MKTTNGNSNIRGKSISEANLLSTEAITRHTKLPPKSYRRSMHDLRTMSEFGSPMSPQYVYQPPSRYTLNITPCSITLPVATCTVIYV